MEYYIKSLIDTVHVTDQNMPFWVLGLIAFALWWIQPRR